LLPIVLTPILIQQLTALSRFDVTRTAFDLFNWFNATVRNLPETVTLFGFQIIIAPFTRQIEANFRQMSFIPTVSEILAYVQQLLSTATTLVSTTAVFGFNVVGGIFQVLFRILVVFFLSLYLTKDLPSIRHYVEELFPKSYQPELREVFRRMGAIWHAFFRGQIALCTVVGISTWLALTVAGMPGALVLGIIAGVMEIIPSIGPTLATVPAVLVALTQGSTVLDAYGISNIGFALITVGIYFIIQQVETSILIPRIIGRSVSLHPVVVICGVAVGLNVAGILGAFLAAPLIATLRVLGSYLHAKLLDYPPFQEPTPEHRRRSRYRHTVSGEATPPKHTNPEELLVVEQRASVPSAEAQA
jgi:predicted PurR-regulated permease PerM